MSTLDTARDLRRAQALRDNLRRRKDQARARQAALDGQPDASRPDGAAAAPDVGGARLKDAEPGVPPASNA